MAVDENGNEILPAEQIQQSKEALDKYQTTVSGVESAFQLMSQTAQNALSGILNYSKAVIAAGSANANTTTLTKAQADTFALMTTQIVGASEAYKSLNAINSRTFGSQLDSLWKTVSQGKNTFTEVASVATSVAKTLGIPFEKVQDAMKQAGGSGSALKALMGNQIATFVQSADNVVKLRDSYFQLMAASGGLGATLERSGTNFRNVNLLVQEQMDKINGASKATGIAKEDIVKYYTELGRIPGALSEQIKTTNAAGGTLDRLTATTRLASATGRNFIDVVADTKNALHAYNLTGADALTFVARMTELSSKFGMELSDTQGFMNTTANTFRFIGNEAEGSARMFNKLMTAFKETGLSARASTELIQGITNSVSNLSIAQKSFLSAQTGGPGGLVGGFQIEKMLRDGKIDEVFEKMRTQMTRQFGKIVSIDEAANSPQAAAQLVRQRAMLQQGPLGQFAKSDAEAQRILDAFAKGQKIDVKELGKGTDILNKNLETGKAWQDQTLSVFTSIDNTIENIRDSAGIIANRIMERSVTGAAEGRPGANIRSAIGAGQREGQQQAINAINRERRTPTDMTVQNISRDIRQGGRDIRTVPNVARAVVSQNAQTTSTTAQQVRRTGVPAASDAQTNFNDLMNLSNRSQQEGRERLNNTRSVGAVNTTTANAPGGTGRTNTTVTQDRRVQFGNVKVDPITVKVVVDASGVARVDHTQQVQAALNLPNGGKNP